MKLIAPLLLQYSLPREACLRLKHQYDEVRSHGTSTYGPFFRVSCLKKDEGLTQLGIIVSRRVGSAVIRNKIKRRLREIYRNARLQLKPHLCLVVIATPKAATSSFQELHYEWLRLGKKLSIFTTPC